MASASIAGIYGMGDDRPFMRITQSAMATSGQDPWVIFVDLKKNNIFSFAFFVL